MIVKIDLAGRDSTLTRSETIRHLLAVALRATEGKP
jgi:hypothetical protein